MGRLKGLCGLRAAPRSVSIREMFGLNCRGKRIAGEDPNHPIAEFRIRVALSNRFCLTSAPVGQI